MVNTAPHHLYFDAMHSSCRVLAIAMIACLPPAQGVLATQPSQIAPPDANSCSHRDALAAHCFPPCKVQKFEVPASSAMQIVSFGALLRGTKTSAVHHLILVSCSL